MKTYGYIVISLLVHSLIFLVFETSTFKYDLPRQNQKEKQHQSFQSVQLQIKIINKKILPIKNKFINPSKRINPDTQVYSKAIVQNSINNQKAVRNRSSLDLFYSKKLAKNKNKKKLVLAKSNWGPSIDLLSSIKILSGEYFMPKYPKLSRLNNEEGQVQIGLLIENGIINELKILKSTGFKRLDQSAVNAIKKWKFPKSYSHKFIQKVSFSIQ